jgi:hypothetical protein
VSYAESTVAVERFGFPIFYELLSLDEALAEEASANESYRDDFGDDFDTYLTSQLDRVREIYAAAHVAGVAYSTRAPIGEWSSAIALADLAPMSRAEFEAAREGDWLRP